MKIVTWNCNGGLWKKFKELENLNADILFIQECENPQVSKHQDYKDWANNYIWIGDNKNKGICFFAKPEFKLDKLNWSNIYEDHAVKYFLPVLLNNNIKLVGVWAHSNNSPTFGYIGQFWKYLQINKDNFKDAVVLGDFNSNKIWDKWDRWWNHSDVLNELNSIKLESVYHRFYLEEQGLEIKKTYFMHRKLEKGYHIDYVFTPESMMTGEYDLQIGDFKWLEISDHLPIVAEFNI
ncbi:endonuclease/exonuclease/phosphatase family protein [uncultured Formosa sp.]|uniref:endonuclease/exonuclease/phosphatase family protein n=1 Tax=uncultured Formosa sp. TaxID=255435 RepID=UPI002622E45E|nr:endonuclease/exonuclease/phosphatase family protein [uncultured Formosa sp.]